MRAHRKDKGVEGREPVEAPNAYSPQEARDNASGDKLSEQVIVAQTRGECILSGCLALRVKAAMLSGCRRMV